jgi:predicted PurR-regulated permease PerM
MTDYQPWPRVVLIAAFLVAIAAGMYGAALIYYPIIRPLLETAPPFVIAIILAFLLDPLIDRMQKMGVSRGPAVAVVGLSFVVVFALAMVFLVPMIIGQANRLVDHYDGYARDLHRLAERLLRQHAALLERLNLPTTVQAWGSQFSEQFKGFAGSAVSVIAGVLQGVLSKLLWLVIIPLFTLLLLKDFDYIKAKIVHLTPERHRDRLVSMSMAVGGVFGNYVRGMMAVAILFSVATMLVLTLAGLDYGLIIGSVAGLFYIVPYVGLAILCLVTALAALVQSGHGAAYVLGLVGYLAVQNVLFDYLITPKVVGRSVGVHPLLMLFSLAVGAQMFGVVGMIVAVPVAAALQVALGQLCPRILDKVGPDGEARKPAKKPAKKLAEKPTKRRRRER